MEVSPGNWAIVLCGWHCDFLSAMQKEREKKKTIRDGFQEYNKVKHQDMVSLKEKEGKTNYKGSFTKRESTIKLSIIMWLA